MQRGRYGSQHLLAVVVICDAGIAHVPRQRVFIAKAEVVKTLQIDFSVTNNFRHSSFRAFTDKLKSREATGGTCFVAQMNRTMGG